MPVMYFHNYIRKIDLKNREFSNNTEISSKPSPSFQSCRAAMLVMFIDKITNMRVPPAYSLDSLFHVLNVCGISRNGKRL